MNLSKNLNAYRRRSGLTQEALAERLGVSRQAVSKWESDRSRPELELLLAMAELYGCTVDDLLQGPPPEDAPPEEAEEEGPDWALFEAYDQEQRAFALEIATGVGLVLFGLALGSLFSKIWGGIANLAFFLPLAIAVFSFIRGGMRHEAFQQAHPDVPDCYTAEEKQAFQRLFFTGLPIAIALVPVDIALTGFLGSFCSENVQGFLFFVILSASVTILVALGILHERFNVDTYNKVARKVAGKSSKDFDDDFEDCG